MNAKFDVFTHKQAILQQWRTILSQRKADKLIKVYTVGLAVLFFSKERFSIPSERLTREDAVFLFLLFIAEQNNTSQVRLCALTRANKYLLQRMVSIESSQWEQINWKKGLPWAHFWSDTNGLGMNGWLHRAPLVKLWLPPTTPHLQPTKRISSWAVLFSPVSSSPLQFYVYTRHWASINPVRLKSTRTTKRVSDTL